MKKTGSKLVQFTLPVSIGETRRPPRNSTNLSSKVLCVLVTALIIFLVCSFFSIQFDHNDKKFAIIFNWKSQIGIPISNTEEHSAPKCPPANCPTEIVLQCPDPTPRVYPQDRGETISESFGTVELGKSKEKANDPDIVVQPKPVTNIVTLYSDLFYGGRSLSLILHWGACFNFPVDFDDVTSSIKTRGSCVQLCEHRGCTGRCEEITNDLTSFSGGYFGYTGINDKTSSIKTCDATGI